jgi:DinB superfamily
MPITDSALRAVLKNQYHAALAMLREAVERCPAEEWSDTGHKNAFWQLAYHTLFFAHLYLQQNEASFRRWHGQHGGDDGISADPYTQEQVLDYLDTCDAMVDSAVDVLDLDSLESGFAWYSMSKLEHQLVNIRHIQHHAAQLADRLRSAADIGIRWVGGD